MTQSLTQTIAGRVRELRTSQGMSAQRLADRMGELGFPWKREIVANLETGRRATVGVDELVGLALVLDVPPTALVVDVREAAVALTPTLTSDSVGVLLWMIGEEPYGAPYGAWGMASAPVRLARRFHVESTTAAQELTRLQLPITAELPEDTRQQMDRNVSSYLHLLWRTVAESRQIGMVLPDVPQALVDEARRRGIWDQELPNVLVAHASDGGAWSADRG